MKKLISILSLILLAGILSYGQSINITVSGTVSDLANSNPIPNHNVTINAIGDSTIGPPFYFYQTVQTNANGVYSVSIPNYITGVPIHVSTLDCQGAYLLQTLITSPYVADFSICNSVTPLCEALFTYYQDSTSAGAFIFTDLSSGNPTSWLWNFGDGTTSTLQNPSHIYAQYGSYNVTLSISGPNCSDTETTTIIFQAQPCNANFYYTTDTTNNTVYFTDISTGSPTSWLWDFGDGSTSTLQNPTHIYAQNGSYSVTLSISGTSCASTTSENIFIGASPCDADFYHYIITPVYNVKYFQDTSTGNPTSWLWDFGDGNTSTLQNPTNTYTAAGSYIVTLTISGPGCSDTRTMTVVINSTTCDAEFSYIIDSANPMNFMFTDLSIGNPTSWLWDFGDGNTSTIQNPSHLYTTPGNFVVTLTINGPNCTNSESMTVMPTILSCIADFYYYSDSTSIETIYFQDVSTGNPTSWLWDFGDGNTSTLQNPIHTYATTGAYLVTLTISGPNCLSSDVDNIVIGTLPCDAQFYHYIITPINEVIYFQDVSTGNPTSWLWDFGDGNTSSDQNPIHTYVAAGSYVVTLTISGTNCSDTETSTIVITGVSCDAEFSYNIDPTSPMTSEFTDLSTGNPTGWLWDFGDGNTSSDQNPTHTYATDGSYVVTLTISGTNCSDTESMTITIDSQTCTADFSSDNISTQYPAGGPIISFTDLSQASGTIISWTWDFDDGTTVSTDQNPGHTYVAPGTYNVSLAIETASCSDTVYIDLIIPNWLNIEDYTINNISIYPNPSTGQFVVEGNKIITIEIIDLTGKQVQIYNNSNTDNTKHSFNLEDYVNGMYFIKILTDKGISIEKVIIR